MHLFTSPRPPFTLPLRALCVPRRMRLIAYMDWTQWTPLWLAYSSHSHLGNCRMSTISQWIFKVNFCLPTLPPTWSMVAEMCPNKVKCYTILFTTCYGVNSNTYSNVIFRKTTNRKANKVTKYEGEQLKGEKNMKHNPKNEMSNEPGKG